MFSDIVPCCLGTALPYASACASLHDRPAMPRRKISPASAASLCGLLRSTAELAPFFQDVGEQIWKRPISSSARAGASTVAELAVMGRPAILIPLPGAIDDHQTANARALGGARVMAQPAFTAAALTPVLADLLENPAATHPGRARSRGYGPRTRRRSARRSGRSPRCGARMRALPLSIGTIHFIGIGGIGMSGIAEGAAHARLRRARQRHVRKRQCPPAARAGHQGRGRP